MQGDQHLWLFPALYLNKTHTHMVLLLEPKAIVSYSNPLSHSFTLSPSQRSSLSSSSSSSSHPLSHSVDQLRTGKVLAWNLRITCRLRKQRERAHRAIARKVRWCSKGQLITVRTSVYVHWSLYICDLESKPKVLPSEWLHDVWSVWNFCSWNGTFRGIVIVVLNDVGYHYVIFYSIAS